MRHTPWRLGLAFLVGWAGSVPYSLAQAQSEVVSRAKGLVEVMNGTNGERVLALQILEGHGLLREAVAAISPEAAKGAITTVAQTSFSFTPTWGVEVRSLREDLPADKLLAALAKALQKRLDELFQANRDAEQQRLAVTQNRLEGLGAKLRNEQEALWTLSSIHNVEVNQELAAQNRMRLKSELQTLDVQSQGLTARQQIIESQIAQWSKQVLQQAGEDETRKALEARIQAEQLALQRSMEANEKVRGTVSQLDLAKAQTRFLEAQAELSKYVRQSATADVAGRTRIDQLRARLDDTAIEIAELNARRETLQEQFTAAQAASSTMELQKIKVEVMGEEFRRLATELSQRTAEFDRLTPPRVTLIPLE